MAKVFLLLQLSLTHDQYSPFIPPCRVTNLSSVLSCPNCYPVLSTGHTLNFKMGAIQYEPARQRTWFKNLLSGNLLVTLGPLNTRAWLA